MSPPLVTRQIAQFYVQPSSNFYDPPCSAASFEVNSEPHTVARPSVRFCVGLIKADILILPRCTSAELFFSCYGSVAALPVLANCNGQMTKKCSATLPAHTQRALNGAHSSRCKSGKTTSFSRSGWTRARHRGFLFLVPNFHTDFLPFFSLLPAFSPACSPPTGCFFARDCALSGGPVR
jgi:hypothetical protein